MKQSARATPVFAALRTCLLTEAPVERGNGPRGTVLPGFQNDNEAAPLAISANMTGAPASVA
jgi:hypothetical protein